MSRNLGGLATFARTAPIRNVYVHALPNKSGINNKPVTVSRVPPGRDSGIPNGVSRQTR